MAVITNENARQRLVRLVEQYQTDLLRLCYIQLHDTALAEDAVQETFIKAYRSFPAFRGDCSEKTWQKHREVILLYYYENMTTDEIAQALGVAKSTVSVRLEQGRQNLRKMLERRRSHG